MQPFTAQQLVQQAAFLLANAMRMQYNEAIAQGVITEQYPLAQFANEQLNDNTDIVALVQDLL